VKDRIVSVLLFLAGILNLTPAIVFFDPTRSVSLYGLSLPPGDLAIIVRHRAVLLGLLGVALIYAGFRRLFVVPAISAALLGKAAFLYLVWTAENTIELDRVAMFDIGAIIVLTIALVLHLISTEK
jgi:hypothetical protein